MGGCAGQADAHHLRLRPEAFRVQLGGFGKKVEPQDIRVLTLSCGQGSDGWSAMNWLQREADVSSLCVFDPSHRGWNDAQLALKDFGLSHMTATAPAVPRLMGDVILQFIWNRIDALATTRRAMRDCSEQ